MTKTFAIGDIHGCADELAALCAQLPLERTSRLVFLGDYIDRGANPRGVIELILELREKYEVVTLMGNHEAMLLDFLKGENTDNAGMFIFNGGGTTLASYADAAGNYQLDSEHLEFFRNLPLTFSTEQQFFVHAGVPDVPLHKLDIQKHWMQLLWIRAPFLSSDYQWGKTIVHGHSIVPEVEICANRINLDTGCYRGGKLTAMEFPSRTVYQVNKAPERPVLERELRDSGARRTVRFKGAISVNVQSEAGSLPFETLNYNEYGMFMRTTNEGAPAFELGQRIEGTVGTQAELTVHFSGIIVRRKRQRDGLYYAVRVTQLGS